MTSFYASGLPARFRQKRDGKEEWVDGEALFIEIDDKKEKVELREKARIIRDKDEVRGDIISVDTRSEFFSVTGGKSAVTGANPEGRVRAVIQPKIKPEDATAAPTAPATTAPSKPAARGARCRLKAFASDTSRAPSSRMSQ